MAPEGLTGDRGEAASDSEEDQNQDNHISHIGHDSHPALLGDHHCKLGTDTSDWAVRLFFFCFQYVG